MDLTILIAIASVLVILLLTLAFLLKSPKKHVQGGVRARAAVVGAGQGRVNAARNQRARLRANAGRQQPTVHEDEEEDVEEEADEPRSSQTVTDDKLGAKKRAKLEAKAEKKVAREAGERLREEKKKREEQLESERKKREELEEAAEQAREEEEKRAAEEKAKRELEEYLALKASFTVEGEGYDETADDTNEENLLQEFLNYIKQNKVVILEDLAAHFNLKTQAAIDRIADLQSSGALTGVVDERGKFIYISQDELEQVAKFVKQRGRVSITDLAESSNALINLNPVTAT